MNGLFSQNDLVRDAVLSITMRYYFPKIEEPVRKRGRKNGVLRQ